ncbi:MAG: hypothetical protein ABEH58_08165 [Haloplanus sp.]
MSTSPPTTDRTAPTLTDGTWRAESTPETGTTPTGARCQFATDCERRLHNLIDEENRAIF